jgi:predicted esterase
MKSRIAAAVLWSASSALAGTLSEPAFTDVSPYSANLEMARRTLSPVTASKIAGALHRLGKQLAPQPVDPAQEHFVLYVPDSMPANGYALMVFVPPWQRAALPQGWGPVLDRKGMIFVSTSRSGNDENVLARRVPLALIAEENVARRYKLDPERIYIGGFSGGSRVALRIALAYPDVFRGAFLDAGSDPIGTMQMPIPSRDLLQRFQTSRFVFTTGDGDSDERIRTTDTASQHSLRQWCNFRVERQTIPHTGHTVADGSALSIALERLEGVEPADARKIEECNAGIERDLKDAFDRVEALMARGDMKRARDALDELDGRYGGLAAPKSLELSQRLAPPQQ